MMQRQELAVCSPKHCGFTIQAKEKNKLQSNATLFLSVHFRNYVSIGTFIETKLRMLMIKYDFIRVFELVLTKYSIKCYKIIHMLTVVWNICMNL